MPELDSSTDTVVVGAGIIGIAVAYYLVKDHGVSDLVIVDARDPMSFTSAQSGENYRNWWPHPVMTSYTDHSIELMEAIARENGNRINMTRRGYVLLTRRPSPPELIDELTTATPSIRTSRSGSIQRDRRPATSPRNVPTGNPHRRASTF